MVPWHGPPRTPVLPPQRPRRRTTACSSSRPTSSSAGRAGRAREGAGATGFIGSVTSVLLFEAKGRDGIEAGSLAGGPNPEHDAHHQAECRGDDERERVEGEFPAGDRTDDGRGDPGRRAIPIRLPRADSTTASTRNWRRMSRVCAPTALRMPISRVRSRTDTSMMFMIPMPPTTSEIEATPRAGPSSCRARGRRSRAAGFGRRRRSRRCAGRDAVTLLGSDGDVGLVGAPSGPRP